MAKKSLVEEALLEAKAIEESVKESAKEILPSVLKKEINELVKESINEVDEIEMDSEELLGVTDDDMDIDMDMDMDMGGDAVELDLTASSDDEVMKVFKKMGPEDEIEVVKTGDGVTLTDGNEEYEIKNVSEGKQNEPIYEIELDDDMNEMMDDDMMEEGGAKKGDQSKTRSDYKNYKGTDKGYHGKTGASHGDQGEPDDYMNEMKDEKMYEIELDDFEEEEIEEGTNRTYQNGRRGSSGQRKGLNKPRAIPNKDLAKKSGIKESRRAHVPSRIIKENKQLKAAVTTYGGEVKKLKSKNEEYKKALSLFREKLNEVAVFNSNLAYTTKLFTEHSTTKKEKLNILSRFDEVNSLKESKSLYKKLSGEMVSKKPIQEAMVSKGGTKVITEESTIKNTKRNSVIRENKVYQDPQMTRMMDLMNKIK
jgi:hypothetical protein|tara:strand:+ start:31364 stop:32632 length:1269 start_codon:yes stop_codon:yes gene_type:complete